MTHSAPPPGARTIDELLAQARTRIGRVSTSRAPAASRSAAAAGSMRSMRLRT